MKQIKQNEYTKYWEEIEWMNASDLIRWKEIPGARHLESKYV